MLFEDLSKAMEYFWSGTGHWLVTSLVEDLVELTLMFHSFTGMRGLGFSKFVLGGIIPFSRAKTALMILASPLAPSRWPTLDLTAPTMSGSSGLLYLPNTECMAAASVVSPI